MSPFFALYAACSVAVGLWAVWTSYRAEQAMHPDLRRALRHQSLALDLIVIAVIAGLFWPVLVVLKVLLWRSAR